jgi:hypothetical protein
MVELLAFHFSNSFAKHPLPNFVVIPSAQAASWHPQPNQILYQLMAHP